LIGQDSGAWLADDARRLVDYLDSLATCTSRWRLTSNDRDYEMGFRVIPGDYGPAE